MGLTIILDMLFGTCRLTNFHYKKMHCWENKTNLDPYINIHTRRPVLFLYENHLNRAYLYEQISIFLFLITNFEMEIFSFSNIFIFPSSLNFLGHYTQYTGRALNLRYSYWALILSRPY